MKLLDLFCGAGGASMGFHRAGFEVVGVDNKPQKNYPFEFYQADWAEYLGEHWREFDIFAASPPCQGYSVTEPLSNGDYPKLIKPVRKAFRATGKPYIIENVPGAPLLGTLMLCGSMFGLRVRRHRIFECWPEIWWPPAPCHHWGKTTGSAAYHRRKGDRGTETASLSEGFSFVTVVGHDYLKDEGSLAMGIDWMIKDELSEAIPPAYTEYIGKQLLEMLDF